MHLYQMESLDAMANAKSMNNLVFKTKRLNLRVVRMENKVCACCELDKEKIAEYFWLECHCTKKLEMILLARMPLYQEIRVDTLSQFMYHPMALKSNGSTEMMCIVISLM
eukprot:Awhi_evm1s2442